MQNSQKTEQALEELRADYSETKAKLDAKTLSLMHNIQELEQQICTCLAVGGRYESPYAIV